MPTIQPLERREFAHCYADPRHPDAQPSLGCFRHTCRVFLLVCVGYTLLGVLRAVIATGFIQTLIILLGVTWVAWLVMDRIGTAELHTAVL